jgi:regulation of enolase protein 1 (concanavalin A-like superfamily)
MSGYLHAVSRMNSVFNDTRDDASFLYQWANRSFYIETKPVSNPQHDYEGAGLMIRQDGGNWAELKYINRSGKVVQFDDRVGGGWPGSLHDHISGNPMYLRLEKDEKQFICYYSTSGVSWTRISGNINQVSWTDPLRVGLTIMDGAAWTNYPANYDYFALGQYVANGSMVSPGISTARPVSQLRATWEGPVEPLNTQTFFYMRANPTDSWQKLFLNYTTGIAVPGTSPQFKIEMSSKGLRTPVLYNFSINLSSTSYPSDPTLSLGAGTPAWSRTGELNSTEAADIRDALSAYVAAATPEADGNVTVPLRFATSSPGTLSLKDLSIEYIIGIPPDAPELLWPPRDGFVSNLAPTLNLSAADADNDTLQFLVELSDDGFKTSTVYNQTAYATPWSNRTYRPDEVASLSLVYPLVQGRAYSWRARAFDGAYWSALSDTREFRVDTTPPAGSTVDEGNVTGDPGALSALLDFSDPESGVDLYEYRIGTMLGSGDILDNATSTAPNVTARGLSLAKGVKYYFTARARDRAGLWSDWTGSDGIIYWPSGTPPAGIEIHQPVNGTAVRGTVAVSGTAWLWDGWGRNNTVQVSTDDSPWKIVAFYGGGWSRNWSIEWDSRQYLDGDHTIRLRVVAGYIDGTQLAIDGVVVNVSNNAPPPPPANITVSFSPDVCGTISMQENSEQEFSFSSNAGADAVAWSVDGRARPEEVYTRFVLRANYSSAGLHNISVAVQYPGRTFRHSWIVSVANIDRPPVAAIFLPLSGVDWKVGERIDFNATTTYDPDAEDVLSYSWELGDGTFVNGSVTTHAYKAPGTYRIVLRASDGSLTAAAYTNITVTSPETIIQGGVSNNLPIYLALAVMVAAAASVGGFLYANRRRRSRERAMKAGGPDVTLLARLPAPAIHDEEEEASAAPRETSRSDWSRIVEEAGPSAAPAPAPMHSQPVEQQMPAGRPAYEDMVVVVSEPVAPVARAPAPAPSPAASRLPQPSRPPAARTAAPAASPRPGPATPQAARQRPATPAKRPETLDDILALLNEKK